MWTDRAFETEIGVVEGPSQAIAEGLAFECCARLDVGARLQAGDEVWIVAEARHAPGGVYTWATLTPAPTVEEALEPFEPAPAIIAAPFGSETESAATDVASEPKKRRKAE